MLIKDLKNCREFIAGDNCALRELLNPEKEKLKIHYSLAWAKVSPGQVTLAHRLKVTEVYYLIEGKGIMHIDDKTAPVAAGQAVYIPPGAVQKIKNTGSTDLIFLCIVDPAWKPEFEEVIEQPGR
jgi:mannose-6-phosphate isomerase-like protein (cupin superfamily)